MSNLLGLCDFWDASPICGVSDLNLCHTCTALFPERREIAGKTDMFHEDGDLGVSTKLNGVPTAFYLASVCALTALTLPWQRFVLHSMVVEIIGRVLISQLSHESTIVTMHQPSTFFQRRSNPKVTMHWGSSYVFVSEWYPQRLHHPASVKPRIGKHYLRLMVHISNG